MHPLYYLVWCEWKMLSPDVILASNVMMLNFIQPPSLHCLSYTFQCLCSVKFMTEAQDGSLHSVGNASAGSRSFLKTSAGPCIIPPEYSVVSVAAHPACECEHPPDTAL